MKQPMNRDQQIDLIDSAKLRVDSRVKKFLSVKIIRESVSKDHGLRTNKSQFTSETILRTRCG